MKPILKNHNVLFKNSLIDQSNICVELIIEPKHVFICDLAITWQRTIHLKIQKKEKKCASYPKSTIMERSL